VFLNHVDTYPFKIPELISVFCTSGFSYVAVWLGLIDKLKTANQIMWLSKKVTQIYPNEMRFFAVSVLVDSVCSFFIRLVWF